MNYPLENLDPERFQQLCQALLIKEHPDIQCFPVGQPDGGRDAALRLFDRGKFTVFQVKFVRRPEAEHDPHKWLLDTIAGELPKVKTLIPKGAAKYYLLTNLSGTGHLDSGSIDKVDEFISQQLGLPSMCWWRDDLNRRLDDAWAIKWAYPDIMIGSDYLRALVEAGLAEHKERRAASIRAFLRHQFHNDEEVKFKQVELQNRLLDLFIDVPMSTKDRAPHLRRALLHRRRALLYRVQQPAIDSEIDLTASGSINETEGRFLTMVRHESKNAAALLLSGLVPFQSLVIEGAPGQGKSTIVQYVCQVLRMKLLQEQQLYQSVPDEHQTNLLRLPIKVDLRDFAAWLNKQNPFVSEDSERPPQGWQKSLESFLAALVSYQSGGTVFSTDDLLAVARISSLLLVFDGLDEVADMQARAEVVDEIVRGTQRLQQNAASLQTIVTSRPAAFANSPSMPEEKFFYFHLNDLPPPQILQYAERWIRAKRLDSKLSGEFRKILKEKLDQPHLRDLARNPMQLAILLSLILTRGASLPDKRTALYDYYIDLFFSRESEKSSVYREHRDLLVDIHRYLAWLLHSEAEKGEVRASISQERLLQVVTGYLEHEGHDPKLANELFTGLVDRVVALVSRVQGTFEFEVQPLREYFAACFLFYTAPQSSPGKEKAGARPDRFDAIAKNFYWLNVTRFYAGCYSKGELPSLAERLQELTREAGFKNISHPRLLAATLLADWVFAQNPKSVQQVVDLIVDGIGIRLLATHAQPRRSLRGQIRSSEFPEIPPKCGRDELVNRCFELLDGQASRDFASEVIALIRRNASQVEAGRHWIRLTKRSSGDRRQRWLEYGLQLGALPTVDISELDELLPNKIDSTTLLLLVRARRFDVLQRSETEFNATVDAILDYPIPGQRRTESIFAALGQALDPLRYALAFDERLVAPLRDLLERRRAIFHEEPQVWGEIADSTSKGYVEYSWCAEVVRVAEAQLDKSAATWAMSIEPWDTIVEVGRSRFGDRWAFDLLANFAVGIKSPIEKSNDFPDLLDASRSLCHRARFARLRPNATIWWSNQFKATANVSEWMRIALFAMTWASTHTIIENLEYFEEKLAQLDAKHWRMLFDAVNHASAWFSSRHTGSARHVHLRELPQELTLRSACLLLSRANRSEAKNIYKKFLEDSLAHDTILPEIAQREALDFENFGKRSWRPNLPLIRKSYSLGAVYESRAHLRHPLEANAQIMTSEMANEIAANATVYPAFLVGLAEERCRQDVAGKIVPVADVAKKDHWFDWG